MDNIGDANHELLQAVMTSKCITIHDFIGDSKLFRDENQFRRSCQMINSKVGFLGIELKRIVKDDGSEYIALINRMNDKAATFASSYQQNELLFLKKIIDVLLSQSNSLASVDALRTASNMKPSMSKKQAELVLSVFVDDSILGYSDGFYYLEDRAILELQSLMDEDTNLLAQCSLCKVLCVKGPICGTCEEQYHSACLQKFCGEGAIACPSCKAEFSFD